MRVLHVEMGRHLYGGARQVAYLLNGLADLPGEHLLVCAAGAEIAGAVHNPAVKLCPLPFGGDLDLRFISRLRRLIRAEKPDLLHIHSRRGDWLAAVAGRLESLAMIHSRRVDNPPRWVDLKLKFPLFRKIVTISEGIRQVLLEFQVPDRQVICIPSAVDTERFRPVCDRAWFGGEFGLQAGTPVLAVIAQLIPRKGHQVLFDALPTVRKRHPDVKVLLFGQGPLEGDLRASVCERGLEDVVHFHGFRSDLDRVIPCLDLVVHPAVMEGLGVSLLEAAACGVPIVASRAGGIPEIVRDGLNGVLVEPNDAQGLALAVSELLDQPAIRQRYGNAGRELTESAFSVTGMVKENWQVYCEIADCRQC